MEHPALGTSDESSTRWRTGVSHDADIPGGSVPNHWYHFPDEELSILEVRYAGSLFVPASYVVS